MSIKLPAYRRILAQPWTAKEKWSRLLDTHVTKDYTYFSRFPNIEYKNFLDVGAHKGSFTKRVLRHFVPENIWMVEADPELASRLRTTFKDQPSCRVVHTAIADKTGTLELRINQQRGASSLLPITKSASEMFNLPLNEVKQLQVPVTTLDEFFAVNEIKQIDLLKVDIQGAEGALIRGGHRALKRIRVIYIEVLFQRIYEGSLTFPELDSALGSLGFSLQFFDGFRRGENGDLIYANACYFRRS